MKQKAFLIIFKGFLIAKNGLRPESMPLILLRIGVGEKCPQETITLRVELKWQVC